MSTVKIDAPAAPKPVGLYPHARRAGNLLFLSGIGPRDPQNDGVPGLTRSPAGNYTEFDFEAQVHSVFRNVRAVLEASGAKWEDIVGYSRAVQVGNTMEVSGTVASDENGVVGKGDFYLQTRYAIQKIEAALKRGGFELTDVVRTRIFVTDISHWEELGRAHGEFFKDIKPVTSMIEIKALIDPDFLVEIEVTAVKAD